MVLRCDNIEDFEFDEQHVSDLVQGVDIVCAAALALLSEPSCAGGNRVSQSLDAARALIKLLRKDDGLQSCGLQCKVSSLIEASEAVLLRMPVPRPQEHVPDLNGENKFQAMKALACRTQKLESSMTSNRCKNSVALDSRITEWTTTIVANAFTIVKDHGWSLVQDIARSVQQPLTTLKTKSSACQGQSVWYNKTTDETSWEEACLLCWSSMDGCGTSRRHSGLWTMSLRRCQVFRFEFDLMSAYNGNCPKAALMTTKDVMNKKESEGFAGDSLPRIVQRTMKLALKLKAFDPMWALDHLSKLIRSGNWTVQSFFASSRFCHMLGQPREWAWYGKKRYD